MVLPGITWMTGNPEADGAGMGALNSGLAAERLSPGDLPWPDPPAPSTLHLSARYAHKHSSKCAPDEKGEIVLSLSKGDPRRPGLRLAQPGLGEKDGDSRGRSKWLVHNAGWRYSHSGGTLVRLFSVVYDHSLHRTGRWLSGVGRRRLIRENGRGFPAPQGTSRPYTRRVTFSEGTP
jgi:hypothetical protein